MTPHELPPPPRPSRGATAPDTLKVSEAAWAALIDRLDDHGQLAPSVHAQRQHERVKTEKLNALSVDLVQPAGTMSRIVGCGHDISASGLRVLHKRYIYPDAACVCWMPHPVKGLLPLPGKVKWCQHLDGMFHCSGIALDQAIDVSDYT